MNGCPATVPLWKFVLSQFEKYGLPPPPTRFRDEIVSWRAAYEEKGDMDTEIDRLRIKLREAIDGIKELEARAQRDELAQAEIAGLTAALKTAHAALETAICVANEAANEWDKAPEGMKAGKILLALAGHRKGYLATADSVHAALETCRAALSAKPREGEGNSA